MMPIAYVAGALYAPTEEGITENISKASYTARELLALGYAVFCPHTMCAGWHHDERFTDEDFMKLCLAILPHCHLLVLVEGWEDSPGTAREVESAKQNGIPVYEFLDEVPHASRFEPDSTSMLVDKLRERRRKGVAEYGIPLRRGNPKATVAEAIEEALDCAVYLETLDTAAQKG